MAQPYISPFVSDGDTFRSANKTSYDLTNSQPAGGPINDIDSGYSHTYTPDNKYLDNFDVAASNNSNFGVIGNGTNFADVENNSIFSKTSLDIEDDRPVGGPNTTNIPNIPQGEFTPTKQGSSTIYGISPFPGGPLQTQEGKNYKIPVQQWSEKRNYEDYMREYKSSTPETNSEY